MKKYNYKDKNTGKSVESDKPLNDPNLKLVGQIKSGQIVNGESKTK